MYKLNYIFRQFTYIVYVICYLVSGCLMSFGEFTFDGWFSIVSVKIIHNFYDSEQYRAWHIITTPIFKDSMRSLNVFWIFVLVGAVSLIYTLQKQITDIYPTHQLLRVKKSYTDCSYTCICFFSIRYHISCLFSMFFLWILWQNRQVKFSLIGKIHQKKTYSDIKRS